MTDIVTTTGRRMTMALQRAIDDDPDRRFLAQALRELAPTSPVLGKLLAALATEMDLAQVREDHALQRLAADVAVQDERSWPQATGSAWFPDTDPSA